MANVTGIQTWRSTHALEALALWKRKRQWACWKARAQRRVESGGKRVETGGDRGLFPRQPGLLWQVPNQWEDSQIPGVTPQRRIFSSPADHWNYFAAMTKKQLLKWSLWALMKPLCAHCGGFTEALVQPHANWIYVDFSEKIVCFNRKSSSLIWIKVVFSGKCYV